MVRWTGLAPWEFEFSFPGSLTITFLAEWDCLRFRVSGFGFWVSGFGVRVLGFGFQVLGFGFRVSCFGFRVLGFGSSNWGREGVNVGALLAFFGHPS